MTPPQFFSDLNRQLNSDLWPHNMCHLGAKGENTVTVKFQFYKQYLIVHNKRNEEKRSNENHPKFFL
jgi:hypothetical protein